MDEAGLRSIALFESLSGAERREIARHADEIEVPEGAELVPGDFLGEMGIVGKAVHSATVVATTPIRAIVMTGPAFRSMARTLPSVAERITSAVEERSRALVC